MAQITKQQLTRIMDAVDKAFREALETEGLERVKMSGKYGELGSITLKFHGVQMNEKGVNEASELAQDFIAGSHYFDIPAKALGETINYLGTDYQIIGMRPRARKAPIIVKRVRDAKLYGLPTEVVSKLVAA
jgi:hypothetical protein